MAEVRAGQDTAKKKTHSLREGKAREGDTSGSMASGRGGTREDATGRDAGRKASLHGILPCSDRSV